VIVDLDLRLQIEYAMPNRTQQLARILLRRGESLQMW
jgi:hypothetical protein